MLPKKWFVPLTLPPFQLFCHSAACHSAARPGCHVCREWCRQSLPALWHRHSQTGMWNGNCLFSDWWWILFCVQVKNLDQMNLSGEEKMSLTLEMLKVTRETLEAGHSIDDLISHGIDLISILLPNTSNCEELRCLSMFATKLSSGLHVHFTRTSLNWCFSLFRRFMSQIATHLVTYNLSSMLFLIKVSCIAWLLTATPPSTSLTRLNCCRMHASFWRTASPVRCQTFKIYSRLFCFVERGM